MTFPATNTFFRTPFFTAISTPITSGAAGSSMRLDHNRVEPRMYTDTLDGSTLNFDTNGLMTTAPLTANECASSGSYVNGVATGTTNGVSWDTATDLVKGTTAAGTNIVLRGTATLAIVATWTTVTWAGGAGAKGCILNDNSATLTAAFPICSFIFSAVLNPAGGSVTVTWTNGFLTLG